MAEKLNNESFIEKARKVHGDKYDYSKVKYINANTKVCIVCPIHGEFWQRPNSHLNGCGCKTCGTNKSASNRTLQTEEFIERAKQVHGDKYDYSKVEYKNAKTKVCIICPKHGEFWQMPYSHLNKRGCKKCKYENFAKSKNMGINEFLKRAKEIHGERYDYSKSNYSGCEKKICIVCPIHGEFWQTPNNHLHGHGCLECAKIERANKKRKDTNEFIERAREVHGDRYDYSKTVYKGALNPITIICKKHGEFIQRPNDHLNGHGCPNCVNSILEENVRVELRKNNIEFNEYHKFEWLINEDTNYPYSIDFYLPKQNIGIECQGVQHFKAIKFFGGEMNLRNTIKRDVDKKILCDKHGIKVIYFLDKKYNKFLSEKDIAFNNTKELINFISNYGKNNT